jgi:cyclophilin family peptidyl-prolyl cis-trans isomerase
MTPFRTRTLSLALLAAFVPAAMAADAGTAPAGKTSATPPAGKAQTSTAATPANEWVVLETSVGDVVLDLFEADTPGHAENFKKLVRQGYYDGSPFHRVIEGFMAQGGGQWGPTGQIKDVGYQIPAEIRPNLKHERGSVSAARTGDQVNPERKSSGSQFYICFVPTPFLDGGYTVFGRVVQGMENVDRIQRGNPQSNGGVEPAQATVVKRAYLKPAGAAAPAGKAAPK